MRPRFDFSRTPRPDRHGPGRGLALTGGPRSLVIPPIGPSDRTPFPLNRPGSSEGLQPLNLLRVRFRRVRNGFGEPVSLAHTSCVTPAVHWVPPSSGRGASVDSLVVLN